MLSLMTQPPTRLRTVKGGDRRRNGQMQIANQAIVYVCSSVGVRVSHVTEQQIIN